MCTKLPVWQYMSCKTALLATYSAYVTSVASEMGTPGWQVMKIGPEGDK
jgi:hypothetical protein